MRRKWNNCLILVFTILLIVGGSSPALASGQVVVDDELDPIIREIHNILPDTDETENYCAYIRDIRMTTLDRDACSTKQLQAVLIRKADVVFKTSAHHKVTKRMKVVNVAGTSLQKVKKTAVSSGYRALSVRFNVGTDQGKVRAKNHIVTQVEATLYLFHAVQKESISRADRKKATEKSHTSSSKQAVGGPASGAGNSAAGIGEAAAVSSQSSEPSSAQGKRSDGSAKTNNRSSSQQEKNVSKIRRKTQEQQPSQRQWQNDAANGSTSRRRQTSHGVDRTAMALWSAAGVAAVFFAVWLIPDWRIIQWYRRKIALHQRNR